MAAAITRLNDLIERLFCKCIIVAVGSMCLAVLAQVLSRYVVAISIPWSTEVGRYLLVWSSLLAAAVIFRTDGHVAVRIFVDLLPDRGRKICDVAVRLAVGAILLAITAYGLQVTVMNWQQKTPVMQVPMGMVLMVIPLSGIVMLLTVIERILRPTQSLAAQDQTAIGAN